MTDVGEFTLPKEKARELGFLERKRATTINQARMTFEQKAHLVVAHSEFVATIICRLSFE